MHQFFEGMEKFAVVTQQALSQLLDLFPILQNLPDFMLPMRRYAMGLHKEEKGPYMKHYLRVKEGIKNGTAKGCFCVEMARVQKEEGFSDDQASYISGYISPSINGNVRTLLEAGSDTTASELVAFIQAMTCFPEVQKKGQEELDAVIGPNRLPTMNDEHKLPYIRQMVKETLRWMPTTLTGAVPHATTRDDEYMGYHIPKGTSVMMSGKSIWILIAILTLVNSDLNDTKATFSMLQTALRTRLL